MKINGGARTFVILFGIEIALLVIIAAVVSFMHGQGRMIVRSPFLMGENPSVAYVLGEAEMRLPENDNWQEIEIGQTLTAGTIVRTGVDGRLDIRFADGTAVRLQEDTRLSIDESSIRQLTLNLQEGSIAARFHRRFMEQKFQIRTRFATAGIRGTSLQVETDANGTRIAVLSGLVEVTSLNAEENTDIRYVSPSTIYRISAENMEASVENLPAESIELLQHKINTIQDQHVLLVSSTILFEANSDRILPESYNELENIAKEIQKHTYSIRILGHAADVGHELAIQELSLRRAERIREYLIDQGIPGRRLETSGLGASKPIASNDTPEGRAQNRRVEFIIID
jgi:outer membrane protein OmpA-like peptidoglycan-associated protein